MVKFILAFSIYIKTHTCLCVHIYTLELLPDGYLIECLARIAPGKTVLGTQNPEEMYSQEPKFVTLKHIYESMLQAPAWADEPKVSNLPV